MDKAICQMPSVPPDQILQQRMSEKRMGLSSSLVSSCCSINPPTLLSCLTVSTSLLVISGIHCDRHLLDFFGVNKGDFGIHESFLTNGTISSSMTRLCYTEHYESTFIFRPISRRIFLEKFLTTSAMVHCCSLATVGLFGLCCRAGVWISYIYLALLVFDTLQHQRHRTP